jgi:hypothetical protein
MNISTQIAVAIALLGPAALLAQTPAASSRTPLDVRPVLQVVDTNGDGCMSHQEWQAAGLPESSYGGLKDANGCVTLEKMTETPAPPGIDLDGDGKLTVEEFRAFDKRMTLMRQKPVAAPGVVNGASK